MSKQQLLWVLAAVAAAAALAVALAVLLQPPPGTRLGHAQADAAKLLRLASHPRAEFTKLPKTVESDKSNESAKHAELPPSTAAQRLLHRLQAQAAATPFTEVPHPPPAPSIGMWVRLLRYRMQARHILRQSGVPGIRRLYVPVLAGDNPAALPVPTLAKSAAVELPEDPAKGPGRANWAVLAPLDVGRHYGPVAAALRAARRVPPWHARRPVVVWRGTGRTGQQPDRWDRLALVSRWATAGHPAVDVGLTSVQRPEHRQYLKRHLRLSQQLHYKYLLAVEGNDVPSSMVWMLWVDALVLMVPPRVQSGHCWEGLLVPWRHYLPLAPDYEDLAEKVAWAEAHPAACHAMIRASTQHVADLLHARPALTAAAVRAAAATRWRISIRHGTTQRNLFGVPLHRCTNVEVVAGTEER